MFSKNYSPNLYFPLMYISPYRNQVFCRPPDHSHLKLPWISKTKPHPPSSIQTSSPLSSSLKHTAPYQPPPLISLFCIQKERKKIFHKSLGNMRTSPSSCMLQSRDGVAMIVDTIIYTQIHHPKPMQNDMYQNTAITAKSTGARSGSIRHPRAAAMNTMLLSKSCSTFALVAMSSLY